MTTAITNREIRVGDCRTLLRELPDESVNCVVTSPPYWGLRDYGTATARSSDPHVASWKEQMRQRDEEAKAHEVTRSEAERAARAKERELLERAKPLLKFLTRGYCDVDDTVCHAAACVRASEARRWLADYAALVPVKEST